MKTIKLIFAFVACFSCCFLANGQNLLGGIITNQHGEGVKNAEITLTHSPSGTVYFGGTNTEGRYSIPNVQTPGPYTIQVKLENSLWEGYVRSKPNQSISSLQLRMREGEGKEEKHTAVKVGYRFMRQSN
jgi:hypothetical protein